MTEKNEILKAARVLMGEGIFVTAPDPTDGGNYTILTDMGEVERYVARLVDDNAEAEPQEGRAADPTDPQYQKCDFCDQEAFCNEVAVTTGGVPEMFTAAESYQVCAKCASRPIADVVHKAFADRDARPQLPSFPKSTIE